MRITIEPDHGYAGRAMAQHVASKIRGAVPGAQRQGRQGAADRDRRQGRRPLGVGLQPMEQRAAGKGGTPVGTG